MAKSLRIKGRGKSAGGLTPAEPLSAYMTRGPPVAPLAYSVPQLAEATSFGKDKIYHALRTGDLVGRKLDKRTIITHPAAVDWLNSLPLFHEDSDDEK